MGGGRVRGVKGGKINSNTESRERRFHYFNTLPPAGCPEKVETRQLLYPPKPNKTLQRLTGVCTSAPALVFVSQPDVVFFLFILETRAGRSSRNSPEMSCFAVHAKHVGGSRSRHEAAAPQALLSPCQEKRLCFKNITSRRFVIREICRCSDSGVFQQKPKCNNKSLCVVFCCCYQIFHFLDFIDAVIFILVKTPPRLFCVCVTHLLSDPGGIRRASR